MFLCFWISDCEVYATIYSFTIQLCNGSQTNYVLLNVQNSRLSKISWENCVQLFLICTFSTLRFLVFTNGRFLFLII